MNNNYFFTIYLKHDTAFTSISKIALKQIILKVLYLYSDGLNYRSLRTNVKNVINALVNDKEFKEVLEKSNPEILLTKSRYILSDEMRETLDKECKLFDSIQDEIIKHYFEKANVSVIDLKKWFEEAVICFFKINRYEWIDEVCRRPLNKSFNKDTHFLDESFKIISTILPETKEFLTKKFWEFIESDRKNDALLLWNYGMSMFSATLLTARNYPDNITIELFQGSTFILDTNVLMSLGLEGHELSESLTALEKLFVKYGMVVGYFAISRDEYAKAIEYRRGLIKKIFNEYSEELIDEINDPWIKTARKRGCKETADLDIFFETVVNVPSSFYENMQLEILDDDNIQRGIQLGKNNGQLRTQFEKIQKERKRPPKRMNALIHDCELVCGAIELNKNAKCWVLSMDKTLIRYGIENTQAEDYPLVISLEVLISILCVRSMGTDVDPEDFAPLFRNLIKFSVNPQTNAFELEDLSYILDTEIKINELDINAVKDVAHEVNKMRIAETNESDIALFIRRRFEREKLKLRSDLDATKSDLNTVKNQRDSIKDDHEIIESEYKKEIKGKLLKQNLHKLLLRLGLFVIDAALGLVIYFFCLGIEDVKRYAIEIAVLTSVVAGIILSFTIAWKWIKEYYSFKKKIDIRVDEILCEAYNKQNKG